MCWPARPWCSAFAFVPRILPSRPPLRSTMMPSGMLTAKSQGQVVTERMAPAMPEPAAEEIAMTMALISMIGPSMCCGKAERRFIMASAMIAPAPSPCAQNGQGSARKGHSAKAQAAEAAVNSATPIRRPAARHRFPPSAPHGRRATSTAS